jgi:hypothetical protein
MSSEQLR